MLSHHIMTLFTTHWVNLILSNASSCQAMHFSGLALLILSWTCPKPVLQTSWFCHTGPCPASNPNLTVLPRICLTSAMSCTGLDPVPPVLCYSTTIPIARMHSWTSKQCPAKESRCGNMRAEHWGVSYHIKVGVGFKFSAWPQNVRILTGSPW